MTEMATQIANRFRAAQEAAAAPKLGNLDAVEPMVRVVCNQGCDELNVDGKSFRRDHRNAFHVPRRYIDRALMTVGGFVEQPLTLAEGLQDVASAVVAMPESVQKAALKAALASLCEPGSE